MTVTALPHHHGNVIPTAVLKSSPHFFARYLQEEARGLGMGIVKVLMVLLLLSILLMIRYFNSILIGTFCYIQVLVI